jgi:hypothetical protein
MNGRATSGFQSRGLGLNPRQLRVGFLVDEVALEHISFRVASVFPFQSYTIAPYLSGRRLQSLSWGLHF